MKTTITTTREIEIAHIRIEAEVCYGEEDIPNDFPGRTGDYWYANINIDTGKIEGWPQGRAEKMFMTVKDAGSYFLLDRDGKTIGERRDNYVPHGVVPGSCGDTIELEITADGTIANWPKTPDVSAFFKRDED